MKKIFKCDHYWGITKKSNVLQLDDMGYPLCLCIEKCWKCGESKQSWVDVSLKCLDKLETGEYVLLKWESL